MLNIHKDIKDKLNYYHSVKKIPNIIFYGRSGTGKKTIVSDFINTIYDNDKFKINNYVMTVNCLQTKGIKLIREDLKFFAKTHINFEEGNVFKSIILVNADKLTIDAQSALRRLIEVFNHSTRFFIIVEDKYKLLKPILSRFCEIFVPEPVINGKPINLYNYNLKKIMKSNLGKVVRINELKKMIELNKIKLIDPSSIIIFAEILYEAGFTGLDIIQLFEHNEEIFTGNKLSIEIKYNFLITFNMVKKEIKHEKLLMIFILNFIILDKNFDIITSFGNI